MVCGYAEILKHSIIKDKKFFNWLKENTKLILNKKPDTLIYAIKKSCKIKISFVNKDVNEKNMRLSMSIEEKNSIKFFEGLVTSFELRQAQLQLLDSQQKYLKNLLEAMLE